MSFMGDPGHSSAGPSSRNGSPREGNGEFDPERHHGTTQYQPELDPQAPGIPKVGETRCYWSLLDSNLVFLYLDPVLANHLGPQAEAFAGSNLLDYVHPDEQSSAKNDLGSVLDSRTLHGSVTRVRYSRLSAIRRKLGHEGPGPDWGDADKIALDKEYMAVDIVVNWAAEGLVLCFIHAVVDLHSMLDNDELVKTNWTNWCGTHTMSMEQIQLLYKCLIVAVPQPGTMSRVYQILANKPGRPLLMSWPPDQGHGRGPTGRDYAKLVENVQIGAGTASGNDAKTSCTRRYKALQDMQQGMRPEKVESVFIPHGAVIFACHKVDTSFRETSMYEGYNHQYYDHQTSGSAYSHPPYENHQYHHAPEPAPSQPAAYHQAEWPASTNPTSDHHYPQQWSQGAESPLQSTHPKSAFPWPSSMDPEASSSSSNLLRTHSPAQDHSSNNSDEQDSSGSVPAPKRKLSPGDRIGGRGAGVLPPGITKCVSCKATSSPEWRKGPSGKKELCNACGLRFARSRAKKEGPPQAGAKKKREKERAPSVAPSKQHAETPSLHLPPVVTVSLPPNIHFEQQPVSASFPASPSNYTPSPSSYAPSPTYGSSQPHPGSYNNSPTSHSPAPGYYSSANESSEGSFYHTGGNNVRITPSPSPPTHTHHTGHHPPSLPTISAHGSSGRLYPGHGLIPPLPKLDRLSTPHPVYGAMDAREPMVEPRFHMMREQQQQHVHGHR